MKFQRGDIVKSKRTGALLKVVIVIEDFSRCVVVDSGHGVLQIGEPTVIDHDDCVLDYRTKRIEW